LAPGGADRGHQDGLSQRSRSITLFHETGLQIANLSAADGITLT
jgi:hypothetical protein